MKVAFIILAYKNPLQLRWLIESLAHEDHSFFIHIDKGRDIIPFEKELNQLQKVNWSFTERQHSFWGSYFCVKALIEGMKQAKQTDDFDYFIHISGQDFPVITPESIQAKLKSTAPSSYFFHFPFDESKWDNKGKDRLETIHFFRGKTRVAITSKSRNPVYRFLYLLWNYFIVKSFDKKQKYYGCEFYFMLHRDALNQLLRNQSRFRLLHYRLMFTVIPEEVYISTMMMAGSGHSNLQFINETGRYIKWDSVGSSPKTLDETDFVEIAKGDYFFARKFDFEKNEIFLNKIKDFINRNSLKKSQI